MDSGFEKRIAHGTFSYTSFDLMTTGSTLRRALRRSLTQEAGTNADARAVAAAAFRAYERFAQQLTPLIGEAGVHVLCARSLHVTQRDFPWLGQGRPFNEGDAPFSRVRLSLEGQEPAVATAAAVALLAALGELLASLIGNGLTARFLREAWPESYSHDTSLETIK